MKDFLSLKQVTVFGVFLILACPSTGGLAAEDSPSSSLTPFEWRLNNRPIPYRLFTTHVMPDESLSIELPSKNPSTIRLKSSEGTIQRSAPNRWTWKAPEKSGLYKLKLTGENANRWAQLNVFVKVPSTRIKDGVLNGYRIGEYPSEGRGQRTLTATPHGFIEVTPSLVDTRLSPRFHLRPFLSKQKGGFPKYLLIRPLLLLKLEYLVEQLNQSGHSVHGFGFISGFRTPSYNRQLGNVPYSRHLWGGAADIFIDESPKNGVMDDLNGDGTVNWRDAQWMADFLKSLFHQPGYKPFRGGLGIYGTTPSHGPFIHVDVRGYPARWTGSGVPKNGR